MDRLSAEERASLMSRVKTKHTQPEMLVRSALHRLGYRYALHRKDLPGTPDIVFVSRKKAVFVHGCFWHGHDCSRGKPPKSNTEFWVHKIRANQLRDAKALDDLTADHWSSYVIWECEARRQEGLSALVAFLDADR